MPIKPLDASKHLPQILEDLKDPNLKMSEIAKRAGVSPFWLNKTLKRLHISSGRQKFSKVTDQQRETIVRLSREGVKVKDIAAQVGVCELTVSFYRKKAGLARHRRSNEEIAKAKQLKLDLAERKVAVASIPLKKEDGVEVLPCSSQTHRKALATAEFLDIPVIELVGEAIAHYIKHLKS